MPDYGHDIQFGTFVQPAAGNPERTVELALLSEELGYELVSFQDHPYQVSYLDTWTLLTWVAAQTERIHVAPNVLNLPLRPPAVTADASTWAWVPVGSGTPSRPWVAGGSLPGSRSTRWRRHWT